MEAKSVLFAALVIGLILSVAVVGTVVLLSEVSTYSIQLAQGK